ncbi:MAG: DUF1015 domain-containing protein [Kiritimatiellia bacterium]
MNVRPFAALRPSPEQASAVAAVPYDVVDAAEARALAAGNPASFLHVSRPEIDMPEGADCSSGAAYAQARRALDALRASGTLVQDAAPRFYVYRQIMGGHVQTGLVAAFDTKDYLAGVLKQHEKTRKDKEDDRTRHIETLQAHTGPAFLTYRDDAEIDAVVAEVCKGAARDDFTAADGIRHTTWDVPAARSDELIALFARIPVAYIADGHHRSAAASRYAQAKGFAGESRWFMAVAFPASQLKILPYNRLVADLNGLTAEALLEKAKAVFTVTPAADGAPASGRHARMFLSGRWYDLAWEVPAGTDVVSSLDVSVLQDRFLSPVLGIDDPRTSPRISFMGGVRTLDELSGRVRAGRDAVAFSMYPVTVGEMMDIADAGAIMPPKSTWFEPKLRSGLFVHVVD